MAVMKGKKLLQFIFFGVKYAEEIKKNKIPLRDIVKVAGIPKSYATEIIKGINLSRYVEVKSQFK